jgi:CRISPR-associated protein Csb2
MTTIELRFPAHRFHATPWGRHVNEGVVEWPPSPYRLLRALYDSWKRKHPQLMEAEVASALRALAAEAPHFLLPKATTSHTRSYLNSNTLDPTDKSLIFDAFVAMNPGAACYMTWPHVELTVPQVETLERLLESLNYVGRSESWVEARLHGAEFEADVRCEPLTGTEQSGDVVVVACAVPAEGYGEERRWLDAIAYSTAQFQKDRRSSPPAMRMVQYVRPADALMTRVPKALRAHAAGTGAVLLGLDAAVLPLVTATIELAEQVRVRLMGIHKKLVGNPSKVSSKFSGKDTAGNPLKNHHHVFILPLANERGRIDRVLIYTRDEHGLDSQEVQAILQLRSLYGRSTEDPIRVVATWCGKSGDSEVRPGTKVVQSATPFVPTLHWRKGRGSYQEFLAEQVKRECRNHGLPEPAAVELLEKSPGLFEWVEFRRNRKDEEPRPGYGFRIAFSEAVPAPFSLGYGCHFGLGQFDAVR